MKDYEKLGVFYLGREYDIAKRADKPDLLLYNSKDLTTHAVCVGMTGSGKTGLCLALLEEAAIDGIPAIAVDPKGDLGNLCLTFPELKPDDFRPWIDPDEAKRKGLNADEYAVKTAETWKKGLADWGEQPERIKKFQDAAEIVIYTPGSNAGLPLTVLKSFAAPPKALLEDADALRERISSAASGLLALMGIDADPIRSREHILISNILDRAWRASKNLDIANLCSQIQTPPFDKVGFADLDTFFPAKARFELAMKLNNLLASPAFAGWMTGEPLDIGKLLYTDKGKPRLAILSIAHLSDSERMFFVTILLNELLAWVRTQSGTSSLRALFYMDEVFGYFPPSANPPAKTPMLTLLKQARAFGLGIVLATQNPVDLDYKSLSNAGTWFLGRLQTERDKARVLDGLEGAAASAGSEFNRDAMSDALSALGNRVFLMNNVHNDQPGIKTRWTLSYLGGPLTRDQIQVLMKPRKAALADQAAAVEPSEGAITLEPPTESGKAAAKAKPAAGHAKPHADSASSAAVPADMARPMLPPGVPEVFIAAEQPLKPGEMLEYRPVLLGAAKVHFVAAKNGVDQWARRVALAALADYTSGDVWADAKLSDQDLPEGESDPAARYAPLPAEVTSAKNYSKYQTGLKSHLYSADAVTIFSCKDPKQCSKPGESEAEFRARLGQHGRENRDAAIEKLRATYKPKLIALHEQLRKAQAKASTERSQVTHEIMDAVLTVGSAVAAVILSNKKGSQENIRRIGTAAKSGMKVMHQTGDVDGAQGTVAAKDAQLKAMEEKLIEEVRALENAVRPDSFQLDEVRIAPRKTDISIERVTLAWTPWHIDAGGRAEAAFAVANG